MLTGPDLIAFLNSRVDDNGLATFVIPVEATGGLGYGLASKEHANEILRPKLELTFTEKAEDPEDPPPPVATPPRQVEALDRGMVAVRRATSQVYVGWRMLATDPADVAFNLYRSANGGAPVKLNATPLVQTTDFVDTTASLSATNTYFVRPVIAGVELAANGSHTLPANSPVQQFLNVPLQIPAGGTTPDGVEYTYNANDASVGDLDGDGQYEIILKWDPSNSKDNSQSGYTGNVYIDAYKLDGTLMWRIDLGRNIRAGAHYTQLLVYDFDGDGKAEVVMKTAPGTIDGQGNDVLLAGHSASADYRNSSGYILSGPEYLTVFNGETGAAMATVPFEPARGSASQWGDTYGNRVDRFTAGVAYLDGERPSIVFGRGYYGPQSSGGQARNEVTAYDFRDGQLTLRWHFKAGYNINGNINGEYVSQGAHSLTIGDVDGDGKDEIVYGAAVINHDGTGLYSTTWGHGDALHMSDMDPSRPGLEIFMVHESPGSYQGNGATFRDAATGELIFGIPATNDVGRGVAADIDPNSPGYEMWATTSDPDGGPRYVYSASGQQLYQTPSNMFYNFLVWWDADLSRELLDGTTISKWNSPGRSNFDLDPGTGGTQQFAPNAASNNGTKNTPALVADILGDWREEVIWRRGDNTALMIFTTVIPSTTRLTTLMHDTQYRTAIAWQNSGYNQPPHPSFFLGTGMAPPPTPNIYAAAANPLLAADFNQDGAVDGADLGAWGQTYGMTTTHGFLPGDADGDQVVTGSDFLAWQRSFGQSSVAAAVASATAPPALVDEAFATLAGDGLPGSADDEATEAELAGDLIAVAAAYDDGSSGDESADEEAARRRRRSDVGVSTLRAGRLRCESPDADSEEFQSAGVAGNFRSFVSTGRLQ
ncbi:MAG: rhamnogalacturonan lyase [Pirellulales bacterium]|nr:rhamnogalacturonan lyase [Pirellulales bacterium]